MPQSRDRDRAVSHRKFNRSISPQGNDRKRSWLPSSNDRTRFNRSPSPKRKDLKPLPRLQSISRKSRSRTPVNNKRNYGHNEGYSRFSSKDNQKPRSPIRPQKPLNEPRREYTSRKRSLSPPKPQNNQFGNYRDRPDRQQKNASPPAKRYQNISSKKPPRRSPSPVPKKSRKERSLSPLHPSAKKGVAPQKPQITEGSIPQRKITSSYKKKIERMTLHSRFSMDDIESFHLQTKDNVTIAILRNPKAIPSDDVTVKKIFDSSLFKMVRKKNEGKKPIFDREEIKQWRHDEKLEDDPDFEERRLIRVKSASKKSSDDLLRMSPDVLRKSLAFGNKSRSRSPRRSPNVRLNPEPDSRYESRFQKHLRKDNVESHKRYRDEQKRGSRGDTDNLSKDRRQVDNSRDRKGPKGDDNDLRSALERRRSGREENFDRPERKNLDSRRFQDHDDRNVVMDQERDRFNDNGARARGQGMERGRDWGRGRGRGMTQQWSPKRFINQDRSFDRRDRFSRSPENFGGRGRGGFRGRGRGRDIVFYDNNNRTSPPGDNYHKYVNHDDRDLSPRRNVPVRGRGSRIISNRGFRGTHNFQFGNRGQGMRGRGRGRGFYNNRDRSIERGDRRSFDRNSDREWKHDMYDSLQTEDEVPHSATL